MPAEYRRRFAYDDWANQEVLRALADHPPQPPITVRWMAHLIAARILWLERLTQQAQSQPVWPEWHLEECASHLAAQAQAWSQYLESVDRAELLLPVAYVNTEGESHESRVGDILDHVLLHGAYHRGQIASGLRHAGVEPPLTDFIHATRSELVSE